MTRQFKLVLVVSLALNVMFAGMILGHMSHHMLWSHGPRHFSAEQLAHLPEDKRKLFEDAVHQAAADMESRRAELADARKDAERLMNAEPFNEEAFLTKMDQVNDLQAQIRRHITQAIANTAKQFTPEERAVIADIVSHPPEHHPHEDRY